MLDVLKCGYVLYVRFNSTIFINNQSITKTTKNCLNLKTVYLGCVNHFLPLSCLLARKIALSDIDFKSPVDTIAH